MTSVLEATVSVWVLLVILIAMFLTAIVQEVIRKEIADIRAAHPKYCWLRFRRHQWGQWYIHTNHGERRACKVCGWPSFRYRINA